MERQTFGKVPLPSPPSPEKGGLRKKGQCFSPTLRETSAVRSQLGLNVYPADGTLLVGRQPLVDTGLMEEVHAG